MIELSNDQKLWYLHRQALRISQEFIELFPATVENNETCAVETYVLSGDKL